MYKIRMGSKLCVALALASRVALADPSEPSEAEKLTRTARTAAQHGRCSAVRALGKRVRELDQTHYERSFAPDPFIAGCREGLGYDEPDRPPPLPRASIAFALVAGHAGGEWRDATLAASGGVATPAAMSLGFRAEAGVRVASQVSLHGSFRYIQARYDVSTGADHTNVATYDVAGGLRYTRTIAGPFAAFVQGDVTYSSLSIHPGSFGGTNMILATYLESNLGVAGRIGGAYAVSPLVTLLIAGGYSFARIDGFDNAWLSLEAGVSVGAFR